MDITTYKCLLPLFHISRLSFQLSNLELVLLLILFLVFSKSIGLLLHPQFELSLSLIQVLLFLF